MLTPDAALKAIPLARALVDDLALIDTLNDLGGTASDSSMIEADASARSLLVRLADAMGARLEWITPASVLKHELVESLSGRSEPSAQLQAMRDTLNIGAN